MVVAHWTVLEATALLGLLGLAYLAGWLHRGWRHGRKNARS